MGWTRLIRPPPVPRRTPRPDRPRRTRRIPNSGLRGLAAARRSLWGLDGSPSPGRSLGRRHSRRRLPLRRRPPSRQVSPRGNHVSGDYPGLRASDEDDRQHVHIFRVQGCEVGEDDLLPRAVGILHYAHRRIKWTVPEQDLLHFSELPVATLRPRVVERDHEVSLGRGPDPVLDHPPRRQQVGEADRTMVVSERRPEQRSSRLRSRYPRHYHNVHVLVRQLQRRRRHRIDTHVTARYQCHAAARTGLAERELSSLHLIAEWKRKHPRPRSQQVPDAVNVLLEPDDELRSRERLAGERWKERVLTRTQANQGQSSPHRQPPDSDRDIRRLSFLEYQLRAGGDHRSLGDAQRPDCLSHLLRRVGRLDRRKRLAWMEVDLHFQSLRGLEQPRFVAFHVDAGEGRDALLCQSGFRQGAAENGEYLFRTRAPTATNAGDE